MAEACRFDYSYFEAAFFALCVCCARGKGLCLSRAWLVVAGGDGSGGVDQRRRIVIGALCGARSLACAGSAAPHRALACAATAMLPRARR